MVCWYAEETPMASRPADVNWQRAKARVERRACGSSPHSEAVVHTTLHAAGNGNGGHASSAATLTPPCSSRASTSLRSAKSEARTSLAR